MMLVTELRRWVNTLEDEHYVGVDEGGLTLIVVNEEGVLQYPYLELGMISDDADDDDAD
jgi:hypothetical protein